MTKALEYDTPLHFVVLQSIFQLSSGITNPISISKITRLTQDEVIDLLAKLRSYGLVASIRFEDPKGERADDQAEITTSTIVRITREGRTYLAEKQIELERWWADLYRLYKSLDDDQLYLFLKSIGSWIVWVMIPLGIVDKPVLEKMLKVTGMNMAKLVDYGIQGINKKE